MASPLLHGRADVALAGGGLTHRRALGPVADGAHGAAPHAHGRRADAHPAGRAGAAAAPWTAVQARSRRIRALPHLAGAATRRARPDASRRRSLAGRHHDVGLAPAGSVPGRAADAVLARTGTPDVLHGRAALLVVGRAAVAVRPALVRLVDSANAAPRRPAEHGRRRDAYVLGTGPLSDLRPGPPSRRSLGARRPGDRRRGDVGAGIAGVPRPGHRRDRAAAFPDPPSSPADATSAETGTVASAVRSPRHPARRSVPAQPEGPIRLAGHAAGGSGGGHRRRTVRPPDGRDESGRRAAVDLLALLRHRRAAGGRQRVLYGVPFHAAARARTPPRTRHASLADAAALEVAGGRAAGALLLGLRSARA